MSLLNELMHKVDEDCEGMTWAELEHKIKVATVNFRRWNKEKPNIIILGKQEYKVLQNSSIHTVNDKITQMWNLQICKVESESMVEAGYIVGFK
jgi:hypothetical protein